jgi:hypothetical protein
VNNTVQRPRVVLQSMLSHLGFLRWFVFVLMIAFYSGTLSSQIISDEQSESKPLRFDTALAIIEPGCSFRPDPNKPPSGPWREAELRDGSRCALRRRKPGRIPVGKRRHSRPFWSSEEKVVLDQFHGDFTHEYIPEEELRWARPFVMGSAGAIQVAGRANDSFTRFSFGLGGGIKVYFAPQPSSESAGGNGYHSWSNLRSCPSFVEAVVSCT